jgi:hypothetical protein
LTGVEPFAQAEKYLAVLMSDLPCKNGWTTAEHAEDVPPDRAQRLLNQQWDHAQRLRFGAAFGKHEAGVLEVQQGLAERGALLGVGDGQVDRVLGSRAGLDRDREPFLR